MKDNASGRKSLMRRITALLISLALVLSMMPGLVFADDETGDPSASGVSGSEVSEGSDTDDQADLDDPSGVEDPEEPEVPVVPQISVTVKGPGLSVKWDKLEDVKSYRVYRSYKRLTGWKLLKKGITGCSYTDKTVKSGRKAYYKVRALKNDGSYTEYSAVKNGIIYRVYIETGHGIGDDGVWDPGCSWNGYQEARLMIPICKSAAKYLRAKGVYVYTDAFSGNDRNLKVTLQQVQSYDVSVLLNIHCDYQYAPGGTMPLYRYRDQKKLAKCLNKGVHKYVKIKNRGLTKRTDLNTLNQSKGYCTACLFETGCISKDNKLLRTKYDAYGKGLAKGVCDYLGIKW